MAFIWPTVIPVNWKNIPIPATHRRLQQAHQLWHQTLENYSDPDAFCVNLNATIQALRSVTFILQKEKKQIPDFAPWYEVWQERMKKDVLMKWLVDARNQIEKEGDLRTHSVAQVSVLANWNGPVVVATTQMDPLMPVSAILASASKLQLPPRVREEGVMILERMWVVKELPDRELLDILAQCYGMLSVIVRDAHSRCGFEVVTLQKRGDETGLVSDEHLGGRLPCMVVAKEARTFRMHLREHALMSPFTINVRPDPTKKDEVLSKYRTIEGSLARKPEETLLDR